jgi:hypothetical protein
MTNITRISMTMTVLLSFVKSCAMHSEDRSLSRYHLRMMVYVMLLEQCSSDTNTTNTTGSSAPSAIFPNSNNIRSSCRTTHSKRGDTDDDNFCQESRERLLMDLCWHSVQMYILCTLVIAASCWMTTTMVCV